MSLVTVISPTVSVLKALSYVRRFSTQAKYDQVFRRMVDETTFAVEGRLIQLEERFGALERLLTPQQVVALVGPLVHQAVLSPSSDRRLLLASAAAGMFQPDFALEEKNRIARVLGSLEPSDIVILRRLEGMPLLSANGTTPHPDRNQQPEVSINALISGGCVQQQGWDSVPTVTGFGSVLSRFLLGVDA